MIQTRGARFKTYLKNFTKESTFNSFIILVMLIIINASLQPNFFSYAIVKSNFITLTPLILISKSPCTSSQRGSAVSSSPSGTSPRRCQSITAPRASITRSDRTRGSCSAARAVYPRPSPPTITSRSSSVVAGDLSGSQGPSIHALK